MSNNDFTAGIENHRRQCLILLVIDTSGSMYGTKIASVNRAIPEALKEMQKLSDENTNAEIQVAVLDFATNASWVADEPKLPEDFLNDDWQPLSADGMTNLGLALSKIHEKLRRKRSGGWIDESVGVCRPGIIFLTDGLPGDNWQAALDKLKTNGWFTSAFKYCLAAGDDLSEGMDVFTSLAGTSEGVHLVNDANMNKLGDYIKLATISISKISSSNAVTQNAMTGGDSDVDPRMAELSEQLDAIDDVVV